MASEVTMNSDSATRNPAWSLMNPTASGPTRKALYLATQVMEFASPDRVGVDCAAMDYANGATGDSNARSASNPTAATAGKAVTISKVVPTAMPSPATTSARLRSKRRSAIEHPSRASPLTMNETAMAPPASKGPDSRTSLK
jgi:hypothetical protein